MSKYHQTISEYEFKDDQLEEFIKFRTIQRINKNKERVFVKNVQSESIQSLIIVGNILDRPEDVTWNDKTSHYETINSDFQRNNYNPAASAGSFCAISGTFSIVKEINAQVIAFPLNPFHPNNPVRKCEFVGNMKTGNCFKGIIDAPSWIGYITTSGTVTYQPSN